MSCAKEVRSFSLEWYEANRLSSPTNYVGLRKLDTVVLKRTLPVTWDDVKTAVLKSKVLFIKHHDCEICNVPIGYYVHGEDLVFDGSCDCSNNGANYRTNQWQNAADWINMQSKEENRDMLMKQFCLL